MEVDTKEQIKTLFKGIERLESDKRKTEIEISKIKEEANKLNEKVILIEKSLETMPNLMKEQNKVQTLELEKMIHLGHQNIKKEFDSHLINEGEAFKKETLKIVFSVIGAVLTAIILIMLKLSS